MELHTLKPPAGSTKKRRRVGRGPGSGLGKTSGRGHKGQGSRSGFSRGRKAMREGGQMPLHRRLPKFGFTNIFKKQFQIINVSDLARIKASEVSTESMRAAGLIKKMDVPVKVLGNGTIESAVTVKANAFSKSAVTKIEAAGGKVEVV
ncbi:MAG: 50S ribosomal protein L15 [candidate division Zixibacteria bacterium]|nr:50S ribosomal protein L15 [candidate division Zixibacteria bacterium]MDH3937953.1 50S ribosomal protein L15 [candidate division Zixibacteria bacterium]